MQRIQDPTAAASLPAVPTLSGTVGYFTEGVVGVTAPTDVRGWWVNVVQEELMALLTAAGITPDTTGTALTQVLQAIQALTRIQLTANLALYCNASTGNDSNTGYSSGAAFLTLTHAYTWIRENIDCNGFIVTVNCTGAFTAGLSAFGAVVGATGTGNIIFDGGGTATCAVTNSWCFTVGNNASLTVQNWGVCTASGTISGSGVAILNIGNGASLNFKSINFGTSAYYHISCGYNAVANAIGPYTISGDALLHWYAFGAAAIVVANQTITLNGTPAFSTCFALANLNGTMNVFGNTFSGSATGVRYQCGACSVISTNGAGASYLPGNAAGSTGTGGQYV